MPSILQGVQEKKHDVEVQRRMGLRNGGWIELQLQGARNLRSANLNGLSDPFCVVSLTESRQINPHFVTEEIPTQNFKSEVVKKTLDPCVR